MNTLIRPMKSEDILEICLIEKDVFNDPWSEDMFITSVLSYRSWVLQEIDTALILGYMIGEKVVEEFSIYNIAVRPEYQRQGLGIQLTKNIIEEMSAEGCSKFFLEVRKSNIRAISLYRKLGFQEIYIRKGYYNNPVDDALIMKLSNNEEEG